MPGRDATSTVLDKTRATRRVRAGTVAVAASAATLLVAWLVWPSDRQPPTQVEAVQLDSTSGTAPAASSPAASRSPQPDAGPAGSADTGPAGSAGPAGATTQMPTRPGEPASADTGVPRPSISGTTAATTVPAPAPIASSVASTVVSTAVSTSRPPGAPATSPSPDVALGASAAALDTFDGVADDAIPADLVLRTSDQTLDPKTNPINGRRGGTHPIAGALECTATAATATATTATAAAATTATPDDACLVATLDLLGFDVTEGTPDARRRHARQAIAVLQLDAGFAPTGVADAALLSYLTIDRSPGDAAGADEARVIGRSAGGRPIHAYRFGQGPRVLVVVGQTHGDEEAGWRVWLRWRSVVAAAHARLGGTTVWVVPTINPDGAVLDTRFLTNGADPNRKAPVEPEQKALYDFALSVHPAISIFYHQNYGWVGGSGASMDPATRYHELTGLGALYQSGACSNGFMWCPIDETLGASSILVELPDVTTPADVRRHAEAWLTLAGNG